MQTRRQSFSSHIDNTPESLLVFNGNKNAHGLYDILLNYRLVCWHILFQIPHINITTQFYKFSGCIQIFLDCIYWNGCSSVVFTCALSECFLFCSRGGFSICIGAPYTVWNLHFVCLMKWKLKALHCIAVHSFWTVSDSAYVIVALTNNCT